MSGHTPGPWEANGEIVYFGRAGGISLHKAPSPEANARLIAAAPDLLEALLLMVKTMRSPPTGPNMTHEFDIGRADRAIAKALTGATK